MPPLVLGAAVLAQILGGLTPVWTKLALEGLPPWTLVFARQAIGLVFLFALARIGRAAGPRRSAPWTARDFGLLLLISWGGFALPQILLAMGADRSTAVAYALLTPLEPIGIVLGGAFLLSEGLSRARAIALVLGTLGASFVVLQDGLRPDLGNVFGDLLMAAGHLAWAIYTLGAKSLLERHDEGRVSLAAVALTLPPLALFAQTETLDAERAIPALVWVFVLAATSTALVTWLWNWALHRTHASTMGILIFVQPLAGLTASMLVLGERTGALALLGAALLLAGVALEVRQSRS
jgi:drug/metabolite transporter (DMT)-like permease